MDVIEISRKLRKLNIDLKNKKQSDCFTAAEICLHTSGLSSHETPFVGFPAQISSIVLAILAVLSSQKPKTLGTQ